ATATAAAVGLRLGLVDGHRPAADLLKVKSADGRLARALIGHLDEAEPARPARHLVHDDRDGADLAVSFKRLAEIILGRFVRQIAHVDVHSTTSLNGKK